MPFYRKLPEKVPLKTGQMRSNDWYNKKVLSVEHRGQEQAQEGEGPASVESYASVRGRITLLWAICEEYICAFASAAEAPAAPRPRPPMPPPPRPPLPAYAAEPYAGGCCGATEVIAEEFGEPSGSRGAKFEALASGMALIAAVISVAECLEATALGK